MIRNKGQGEDSGDPGVPPVSIFRRATVAAVVFVLCFVPLLLDIASTDSGLRAWLVSFVIFWFPLWVVFAVWVTLDAAALFSLAGPRPDPLGSKAFTISLLGLVNIVSACLFVGLSGGK